jgi:hypothetical protein
MGTVREKQPQTLAEDSKTDRLKQLLLQTQHQSRQDGQNVALAFEFLF